MRKAMKRISLLLLHTYLTETAEENAPVKKTWTVFLVFLRVRRKSFDYSAAPTTRLADSGFLYVLVLTHVSAA